MPPPHPRCGIDCCEACGRCLCCVGAKTCPVTHRDHVWPERLEQDALEEDGYDEGPIPMEDADGDDAHPCP